MRDPKLAHILVILYELFHLRLLCTLHHLPLTWSFGHGKEPAASLLYRSSCETGRLRKGALADKRGQGSVKDEGVKDTKNRELEACFTC